MSGPVRVPHSLSGINAVIFYSSDIFQFAGVGACTACCVAGVRDASLTVPSAATCRSRKPSCPPHSCSV